MTGGILFCCVKLPIFISLVQILYCMIPISTDLRKLAAGKSALVWGAITRISEMIN